MRASHAVAVPSTSTSAVERLRSLLDGPADAAAPVRDFREFEEELHKVITAAERELLAAELARHDVDVPAVVVDGVVHRRVLRGAASYLTRAGEVRVERTLYRASGGGRTVVPMELSSGVLAGYWSPWAAMLAVWAVAHLTPAEAEELFGRVGGMTPSRSALDRLPRRLSERWEGARETFEAVVRSVDPPPTKAKIVAVSLDGILVPMKDGERQTKRATARRRGKETRGPAGFREAACGTITLYDESGLPLETRYAGRMPERNKATLKRSLAAELDAVLAGRPDLEVVVVADGARDNWTWLDSAIPDATQVLDFFHAAEHLKRAMDAAHGEGSAKARAEFERLRLLLRDEIGGVDKVIHAIAYRRRKHPRRDKLRVELGYFRRNRHRMNYAELQARRLPIGSGVVEAANKTLVTVRMKRAGSRWSIDGGQAILTFRALAKSARYDIAWELLAATYIRTIEAPENVVPIRPRRGAT